MSRLKKILKLLENLNLNPEDVRTELVQLREELIKVGGKPVSTRSAWNIDVRRGIPGGPYRRSEGATWNKGRQMEKDRPASKRIRIPRDTVEELEVVVDVIPTGKALNVYVHFPRLYNEGDIRVKLDSSKEKQELHVITPDKRTAIAMPTKVKEKIKWKLNNDTLIVTLEKNEKTDINTDRP